MPSSDGYRERRSIFRSAFDTFARSESFGGIALIASVLIALGLANSPLSAWFAAVLTSDVGPQIHGRFLNVLGWVNDGLMSVFFLSVGLEIRRELGSGELASADARRLPLVAALGGMLAPAAIYLLCNLGSHPEGWAIPSATDIAFSLGILALLGRRIPRAIKVFVTALAIIDDLGAVVIIALFYRSGLSPEYLVAAVLILGAQALSVRYSRLPVFSGLILGSLLWYTLLESGIHPTIAGVATGLLLPPSKSTADLERRLVPVVAYAIVPVFALANAGLSVTMNTFGSMIASPISFGILLGLLVGKPLGIIASTMLVQRFAKKRQPQMKLFAGAAMLCGIGFTMSIFITGLAFSGAAEIADAKLGILAGSLLSGILGYSYLRLSTATEA